MGRWGDEERGIAVNLSLNTNFLHTSCNDKIASIIYWVTYKILSLAEVLGIKVSPPFFKEGWTDHKII